MVVEGPPLSESCAEPKTCSVGLREVQVFPERPSPLKTVMRLIIVILRMSTKSKRRNDNRNNGHVGIPGSDFGIDLFG